MKIISKLLSKLSSQNMSEMKDGASRLAHIRSISHSGPGTQALPRRVCIINYTGDRANWGCQTTSIELVRLLNKHWPSDQPFALDVIPLAPHHNLDREIPDNYGAEIYKALLNPSPSITDIELIEKLARLRYLDFVDILQQADLVLFQAEGTMTGTDFLRAERLLLLPWLAKHGFHKPVISLNQTLFSANNKFAEALFTVLTALDRIWVREPASLAWLHNNGLHQARLVADTAFLTDPLEHGSHWKNMPKKDYFCVTGSAVLETEMVEPYIQVIHAISKSTGLMPVFVCSAGIDRQLPLAAAKYWQGSEYYAAPPELIYQGVAALLANAQFLIGGRYHMSILAAISGTPSVLAATNTHKLSGLADLLGVDWPIRNFNDTEQLVADAQQLCDNPNSSREQLKHRVTIIRDNISDAYINWHHTPAHVADKPSVNELISARGAEQFRITNTRISERFRYPVDDSRESKLGGPLLILRQLTPITVYLRRGIDTRANFLFLRQLIEGNLELSLAQLNSRWLVSICDSYADFGEPIEARNALLISTFLNWERLASTYIDWVTPDHTTKKSSNSIPEANRHLWDGLYTVHLRRGDTTNNLFIRYAKSLESTPHLFRIWQTLLSRIRENDSVLAALNASHKHMFEEDLTWLTNSADSGIPPWRI